MFGSTVEVCNLGATYTCTCVHTNIHGIAFATHYNVCMYIRDIDLFTHTPGMNVVENAHMLYVCVLNVHTHAYQVHGMC